MALQFFNNSNWNNDSTRCIKRICPYYSLRLIQQLQKHYNLLCNQQLLLVTMATYCGQNLGAKEYNRIKEGVKACTKISIITSIIAGAVLIFLGKYFVMMFISNPDVEILKYAQQVLDISAIFFIPLGLIFIYRNALQGIGDSFVPMMAGAYELIARAIVAFTLPQYIGFLEYV